MQSSSWKERKRLIGSFLKDAIPSLQHDMLKKINYPILSLIIANIIWGAASPIFKFSLQNIPPFSLAFLRFLFACLIMYPFIHKRLEWSDLKNKYIWGYAITGITLNIGLFFVAIQQTASINAPVIGSAGPIFILLASIFFLKEKVKKNAIIGTLISLCGIIIIVIQPLLDKQENGAIFGNILLILATLSVVAQTIIGKESLTPKNVIGYTFWAFFIGTISFLPLMLWEFNNEPTWFANLDYRGVTGIIFGALFSSVIAYTLYNWALSKLPAYKTSVFAYMDPIVAIVIAVPLLGEKITTPFIFGSVLVFVGILIAEKRVHYHPLHKLLDK